MIVTSEKKSEWAFWRVFRGKRDTFDKRLINIQTEAAETEELRSRTGRFPRYFNYSNGQFKLTARRIGRHANISASGERAIRKLARSRRKYQSYGGQYPCCPYIWLRSWEKEKRSVPDGTRPPPALALPHCLRLSCIVIMSIETTSGSVFGLYRAGWPERKVERGEESSTVLSLLWASEHERRADFKGRGYLN